MIKFENIKLRRGRNILFEQLNWTIYHKQRIGLIGANGSGKTSLFALIMGELEAETGEFTMPARIRLAHVAQETQALPISAREYVLQGDAELCALQIELLHAEEENDGERIAELHEKISVIDGYTATARAAQLLDGLGFSQHEQQQAVSTFSGGWRVRLNLARALMCRSDILLLDEPTNHLDLDAVVWLENWLKNYHGILLIISHDRDFLDHAVDHIAHLSQQKIKLYTGTYSDFEKQRAEFLLLQQAAYEKQQKQIAHIQSFVDRFRAKASKARQAQSRVKAIERMDLVCAVQTESAFQFTFKSPEHCPTPLMTLDDAYIAYGDHTVLRYLNWSLTGKDRIAILGCNGAGKSSFIKLLAGEISPAKGVREASPGLKIGYFAQHQVDHLQLDDSPMLHLKRLAPTYSEQELRTFLGSFGFIGETVFQSIREFSGGEKSRLALALIVWQRPNLLLLDEPTNHLDLEMRQALSIALQEYEGAMILVSHDRYLVRTTTDQLFLVANQELNPFDGDLDDYEKWLLDYRKQQASVKNISTNEKSRKEQRQKDANQREKMRPLLQRIKLLEMDMEKNQRDFLKTETILADNTIYADDQKNKLQTTLAKQVELKKKMERLEEEWLQACVERDNLQ